MAFLGFEWHNREKLREQCHVYNVSSMLPNCVKLMSDFSLHCILNGLRLGRLFIAVSLFIFCLPPQGSAEAKLEPVTLQLRWYHQFQFAGYYAALEKGYYREAGLDVTILQRSQKQDPIEMVVSGQAEFGVTNSELLLHAIRGRPVVVLAAIFQHSPLVLLAKEGTEIHSNSWSNTSRIWSGLFAKRV